MTTISAVELKTRLYTQAAAINVESVRKSLGEEFIEKRDGHEARIQAEDIVGRWVARTIGFFVEEAETDGLRARLESTWGRYIDERRARILDGREYIAELIKAGAETNYNDVLDAVFELLDAEETVDFIECVNAHGEISELIDRALSDL